MGPSEKMDSAMGLAPAMSRAIAAAMSTNFSIVFLPGLEFELGRAAGLHWQVPVPGGNLEFGAVAGQRFSEPLLWCVSPAR